MNRSINPAALTVLVLLFFWLSPSHAGRYDLVKGKGVDVCEAYKKNLESFDSRVPMVCERLTNPKFKDFEKPIWQKADVRGKDRELLRRVLRYQAGDRDQFQASVYGEPDLGNLIERYSGRERAGNPLLSRTQVDIDNDGRADDIAILRYGFCPDTSAAHFETNIFILKPGPIPEEWMIDSENKMEKLIRQKISPGQGDFATTDLFRYKYKTYIDKYCAFKNRFTGCDDVDILIVFKMEDNAVNEICRYKYHQ